MQLATEVFGDVMVAHTPDDLTDETVDEFLAAFDEPISKGHVKIVLQMDRSDVYDSVGLTALLDLQDRVRKEGGNLKVSGLADPGRKIFEMTRLDHRFDLFDSVINAVSSFQ